MKSSSCDNGAFNLARKLLLPAIALAAALVMVSIHSCDNYYKNDYKDNSPTSGQLKLYFDEGLFLHARNQARTFTGLYANASVTLYQENESKAIEALYNDSCEAIMVSRLLGEEEKKAFASKQFNPRYSAVALSGVALITNFNTPVNSLSSDEIKQMLNAQGMVNDSLGHPLQLKVVFPQAGSSVMHYLADSVIKSKKFSSNCRIIGSSPACINYVAQNKNTVAFIDFAWLSDRDDSIYKANTDKIRFVGIKPQSAGPAVFPSQSSFKLQTYPYTQTIYMMRKTGEFTLAKGFESFVAGPKGQLTFLKQGLLPYRQAERVIEVKMEPMQLE